MKMLRAGVALIINKRSQNFHIKFMEVSERIVTARFNGYGTLLNDFCAYAPQSGAPDKKKG